MNYELDDLEVGMVVEWNVRQLMGGDRPVQGTITQVGMEDRHKSDWIVTDCPTDPSGEAIISPEDVTRIVSR